MASATPDDVVLEWASDEPHNGTLCMPSDKDRMGKEAEKKWADALSVTAPGHMYSKDGVLAAMCCCCCSSRTVTDTRPFAMSAQLEPNLWRSALALDRLADKPRDGSTTIGACFDGAVKKFGDDPILGTRRILSWAKPEDSKYWCVGLGPYEWLSYAQVNERVDATAAYLQACGLKRKDIITIFSETRCEWMITALACWKLGIAVGTAYANLGVDALCYGVNQMEAKMIVCEASNAKVVGEALAKMPSIQHVLFFEDQNPESAKVHVTADACRELLSAGGKAAVASFGSILSGRGEAAAADYTDGPSPTDMAVIMYTSGSTGNPKGVMISHANAIASMAAFEATNLFNHGESHCAVYPLAHIMEIAVELGCMSQGMRVGYGTTKTMVTGAPFLAAGTQGDLATLQPTFLLSVPLILDRIKQKVTVGASKKISAEKWEGIVERAKQARAAGTKCMAWYDVLVLNKIRAGLLGSNLKLIVCGSAPLSADTEEWASAVLGAPILQGYAMTETTCAGTLKWANDFAFGTCGAPMVTAQIKLVDWAEGNYKVVPSEDEAKQDPPIKAGGEILISGPSVSMGYFKMPEKTAKDFVMDRQGRRWFRTGDVGVVDEWGCLKIIDRKKDIKKLLGGEYISYGKIEPIMKSSPLVDNACVYADSTKTYCIAFVTCPVEYAGKELPTDKEVLESVQKLCKAAGLKRFEVPRKIYVEPECVDGNDPAWNANNNLTTSTFKIKRVNVMNRYKDQAAKLYKD